MANCEYQPSQALLLYCGCTVVLLLYCCSLSKAFMRGKRPQAVVQQQCIACGSTDFLASLSSDPLRGAMRPSGAEWQEQSAGKAAAAVTACEGPSAAAAPLVVACCCRYQFLRFGREGYKAINKAMYDVMVLLKQVRPPCHVTLTF